jgi:hypothetical protein
MRHSQTQHYRLGRPNRKLKSDYNKESNPSPSGTLNPIVVGDVPTQSRI